jgi:thioredoxin reductase
VASVVAIVGAGEAGLACARQIAGRARTVVVDRRPVEGADHQATAIRWDGAVLLAMGPAGPVEIAAHALVIATGTRPLGRAELGLVGTRPAGVLSAPAACELADQGLVRPARPAVIGGGDWAARAVMALAGAGAEHVTVVAPDGILTPLPPSDRITVHEGLAPLSVGGDPQVERLECDAAAFDCDAIVLAHGLVPVRNVDGAVSEGVGTVYAQPLEDPRTEDGARRAGAEAAHAALALTGSQATIGPWWSSPNLPPSA